MAKHKRKNSAAGNCDDPVASAKGDAPQQRAEEERREASPERETAERQLKRLNSMLLKETVEKRSEVTALAARVDELVAEADVECSVFRAALAESLLSIDEEAAALGGRLAAVQEQESLELAEARTVLEQKAKDQTMARLKMEVAEKDRLLKLLGTKEAEVAPVSKKDIDLEAMIACTDRSELAKQLEKMEGLSPHLQAEPSEVEGSFMQLTENTVWFKEQVELTLEAKERELEALRARRAEMEAKVESLEAELSVAAAENWQLKLEAEANKTEVDSFRREVEKLRSEVAEAEEKHMTMAAETDQLWVEMTKLGKMKEAVEVAFHVEKTEMERELDALKWKLEQIQFEKDAAEGTTREKDGETSNLRAELEKLRISKTKPRALCNELNINHSRLQDEKDSVLKLLDAEKAKAGKLSLSIEELESCYREVGVLKAALQDKGDKINGLNREIEQLQLAVAEGQRRRKSGVSAWLCAATTTAAAVASFVYATRRQ